MVRKKRHLAFGTVVSAFSHPGAAASFSFNKWMQGSDVMPVFRHLPGYFMDSKRGKYLLEHFSLPVDIKVQTS